eukprot:4176313-Lingulodinium_polyedra.AAC.1
MARALASHPGGSPTPRAGEGGGSRPYAKAFASHRSTARLRCGGALSVHAESSWGAGAQRSAVGAQHSTACLFISR